MAYRRRGLRRRKSPSSGKWLRGYMLGIVFLVLAVFTIGAVTYLTNVIPDNYIWVNGTRVGVGTTVPSGATGVSSKLIVGVLGWAVGIIVFISAINRLKVRI
jgi:hypothetical protein